VTCTHIQPSHWHVPTYMYPHTAESLTCTHIQAEREKHDTEYTHVSDTRFIYNFCICYICTHTGRARGTRRYCIHTCFGYSLYFFNFLFLHMHTYRSSAKSETLHTHMIRTLPLFFSIQFFYNICAHTGRARTTRRQIHTCFGHSLYWILLNFFFTYAHIQAEREEEDAEYTLDSDTRFIFLRDSTSGEEVPLSQVFNFLFFVFI